jgi:hypothetical protein
MRTVTKFVSAAVVSLLLMLLAVPANAQVLNGSIVGQVADTTNAVVPDATVRLTHRETGQSRVTTTNDSGDYSFPTLSGGSYDLVISKDGFQSFTARAVALAVGQVARVDAALLWRRPSLSSEKRCACRPIGPRCAAK